MNTSVLALWVALAAGLACNAAAADVDFSRPPLKVPHKAPLPQAADAGDHGVEFTHWKSALIAGDVVGRIENSIFCGSAHPISYTKRLDDLIVGNLARKYLELAPGMGVAKGLGSKSAFEDKSAKDAGFQLGATLLEWDYRVCVNNDDIQGDAYAKMKWELYSTRHQKVVYSAVVEASHSQPSRVPTRKFDGDLMQAMIDNLFADPALAEAIRSGGATGAGPAKRFEPLPIAVGATARGGVAKAGSALLAAVATVESGMGSGSGFYVSRDGYLLTNQHVVGGATFVRVRLADGRSLVGEVLRADPERDVALVRTDPVAIDVLALRPEEARVGEDVYAIGSPMGQVLNGTLTRGVLSARRVLEGTAFLQSDVAVNPGSSGGPMIDTDGRVLGIATTGARGAQGLNLFVPIGEAIDRLGLALSGPGTK